MLVKIARSGQHTGRSEFSVRVSLWLEQGFSVNLPATRDLLNKRRIQNPRLALLGA
jgi:hypothetical protein